MGQETWARSSSCSPVRARCCPPAFLHASRCAVTLACMVRTTCTDGSSHGVSSRLRPLSSAVRFLGVASWICAIFNRNLLHAHPARLAFMRLQISSPPRAGACLFICLCCSLSTSPRLQFAGLHPAKDKKRHLSISRGI